MGVAFARNGDIKIAYDMVGPTGGRPLLLIQGGIASRWGWPDDFCADLVKRGFQVARFDNRDAGESSRATAPYTLADLAADATAVQDTLNWTAAHVVGVSMGGMVAQIMATRHADRVLSLTSISSAPDHFQRWNRRKVITLIRFAALHRRKPADPGQAAEQMVRIYRLTGSTGYPHDEDWIRDLGHRTWAHRADLAAFRRQARAVRASGDRRRELAGVKVPTLVITGEADPLQTIRAGRATAAAIPGARFVTYPGMGHDLPRPLWPSILDEIDKTANGRQPSLS